MTDIRVFYNKQYVTQGYIGYNNGSIILAFRGSTISIANWINNLNFKKVPYEKCKGCAIHKGFFLSYKSIEKEIINNLDILIHKYPNAPIIITGHSLGGVIATLAALDI